MGATKTPLQQYPPQGPKTKNPLPLLIAGAFALVLCALAWSDVVEYFKGEPRLIPKYQRQLERKLIELDEADQYALIATTDGMYPCLHSSRALYHLRIGEVWKYGVTAKGERGRYTAQFLQDNAVSYIIQLHATFSECLKEEQRKLFTYPLLPENLARKEDGRLLRPPYNPVLR